MTPEELKEEEIKKAQEDIAKELLSKYGLSKNLLDKAIDALQEIFNTKMENKSIFNSMEIVQKYKFNIPQLLFLIGVLEGEYTILLVKYIKLQKTIGKNFNENLKEFSQSMNKVLTKTDKGDGSKSN